MQQAYFIKLFVLFEKPQVSRIQYLKTSGNQLGHAWKAVT
jgi:hypothetical protein